jgi:hypothetical protein
VTAIEVLIDLLNSAEFRAASPEAAAKLIVEQLADTGYWITPASF